MYYIILIIFLGVFLALQLLLGDFPVVYFAFPVNVILLAIWVLTLIAFWRKGKRSGLVRFMLSSGATFTAVGLLLLSCFVIGLTGNRDITGTWVFVTLLLYFQTVLFYVILRGWRAPTATGARLGSIRWRFIFIHAGLLLTVMSAFWGAPDSETVRLKAYTGVPVAEAYHMDGKVKWLDYEVILKDFAAEYDAQGMPSEFEATVDVGGKEAVLNVNHPYTVRMGEDVYLSGFDSDGEEYCILQIVYEPWKYGVLAGIIMMLTGAFMLFVGGPRRNYRIND